jgi:hypothetical protein
MSYWDSRLTVSKDHFVAVISMEITSIQKSYSDQLTLRRENGNCNSGVCIEELHLLLQVQSSYYGTMSAEDHGLGHLIAHAGVQGGHGQLLVCRSG